MDNKVDSHRDSLGIWVCYIMMLASIGFPMMMLYLQLRHEPSLLETLVNSIVVLLPFFIIPPRFRWTGIIVMWLVVLFCVTNKWYMRFFYDLMPLSSYFLWNNIDDTVIDTAASVMKEKDLVFVVLPSVATYVSLFRFKKAFLGYRFKSRTKIFVVTAGFLVYFAFYIVTYMAYEPDEDDVDMKGKNFWGVIDERCIKPQVCPWVDYDHIGFVAYIVKQAVLPLSKAFKTDAASPQEIELVNEFENLHAMLSKGARVKNDTVRQDKNLVLIIVESLNSWVIGKEYAGHKVTPVLDSLIARQGTLSALKMVTQVHSGVSSDGQFIYNTGMYPSSEVTTVSYYTDNSFDALPKLLKGYTSFEVICESSTMWNHSATTRTYGYDYLFDNINYLANQRGRGKDETMFDFASAVIDTISRPFFAELTTISMHAPYKDPNVRMPEWVAGISSVNEDMRNYIASVNYFDRVLGSFLDRLSEQPDHDNTLVVIVADHRSMVSGITAEEYNVGFIPFIALDTYAGRNIPHAVGQVDVFPTILDLMGIHPEGNTGHMGLSMFNPVLKGAVTSDGRILGDSVSGDFRRMLELSGEAANIILRHNL